MSVQVPGLSCVYKAFSGTFGISEKCSMGRLDIQIMSLGVNVGDGLGVPFKVCSPVIFIILTVFLDVLNIHKEKFQSPALCSQMCGQGEETRAERHNSKHQWFSKILS